MAVQVYEIVNRDRDDIRAGNYPYNDTYLGSYREQGQYVNAPFWYDGCKIVLSVRIEITGDSLPDIMSTYQKKYREPPVHYISGHSVKGDSFKIVNLGVMAHDARITSIFNWSRTVTARVMTYNGNTGVFENEETVDVTNFIATWEGTGSMPEDFATLNIMSSDQSGFPGFIYSYGNNYFSDSVAYSWVQSGELGQYNGYYSYDEANDMDYYLVSHGSSHFQTSFTIYSSDEPNSYFTIMSGDLLNIPSGMMAASYHVSLSRTANPQSIEDSYFEDGYVDNGQWEFTWQNYYLTLSTTQKAQAAQSTEIPLYLQIWHLDGSTRVFDLTGEVQLYEDGRLLDVTSDENVTLYLHSHEDPDANQGYRDSDETEDPIRQGQIMNVDNVATVTYICDNAAIRAFAMWLWRNNTITGLEPIQVSPIENIISCKRIPFAEGGTNDQIRIGNLDTHIGEAGGALEGHVKVSDSDHYQYIGSVKVPTFNSADKGSWIDMQNNISIYLPYCGIQSIPTGLVYKQIKDSDGTCYLEGRMLNVEYYYDLIYGTCAAVLSTGPMDNKKIFAIYNGECGSDIPLTQSNRAENQLAMKTAEGNMIAGMMSGAVTGAAVGMGAAGGNPMGALVGTGLGAMQSGASAYMNMVNLKNTQSAHYTVSGGFSSQVASFLPSSVVLYIDHVIYTEPTSYAHDMGYPCYLTKKLSNLKGYTEIAGECDIKHIPCFEEERRAIKQALMAGFIL